MAFSKIQITFEDISGGVAIGDFLEFKIQKNGGTADSVNWEWFSVRSTTIIQESPNIWKGQIQNGSDPSADAANFQAGAIPDISILPNNELTVTLLTGGDPEVVIEATVDGYQFLDWNESGGAISHIITNSTPATVFKLDSVSFDQAVIPCTNVEATVLASFGVPPYTWILPSNPSTTLIADVPRTGISGTITIEDSTTAQASIQVSYPQAYNSGNIEVNSLTNQSGFDATVTATITGTIGLTFTYSVDGSNFQASNVFPSMTDGSYTMSVLDQYGCLQTQAFDVDVAGNVERPPEVGMIEQANSIDYKLQIANPDGCSRFFVDQYLYNEMAFVGQQRNPYCQPFQHCDVITTQTTSNYDTQTAEIIDKDGATVRTLNIELKVDNTGLQQKMDCVLYNYGNNETGMYFLEGNEYIPNTTDIDQEYVLNGQLPEWAKIGQTFALSNSSNNGTFQIVQIVNDKNVRVCVFGNAYQGTGETEGAHVQATYDRLTYDEYEFVNDWKDDLAVDLPDGCYQVRVILEDSLAQYNTRIWLSQQIALAKVHPNTVVCEYSISDRMGIDYDTGIIHRIRFFGLFFEADYPYTDVDYRNSGDRPQKLKSVPRQTRVLEFIDLPEYMLAKLSLALAHFSIFVNGVRVFREEDIEKEKYPQNSWYKGTVVLETVDFQQHSVDNLDIDLDQFLLQNSGEGGLLKQNS